MSWPCWFPPGRKLCYQTYRKFYVIYTVHFLIPKKLAPYRNMQELAPDMKCYFVTCFINFDWCILLVFKNIIHCSRIWMGPKFGLVSCKRKKIYFSPVGDRAPNLQVCSKSPYHLCYIVPLWPIFLGRGFYPTPPYLSLLLTTGCNQHIDKDGLLSKKLINLEDYYCVLMAI
jgi:hypothetical protein